MRSESLGVRVVAMMERFIENSRTVVALSMEGLRANPSPISDACLNSTKNHWKKSMGKQLQALLQGSALWRENVPRSTQVRQSSCCKTQSSNHQSCLEITEVYCYSYAYYGRH